MNLSEYIQQDLKALLTTSDELPFKLTLAAISAHYRVSIMPVRGAVETLIDEGYIVKQANGRLVPHPDIDSKTSVVEPPQPRIDAEKQILELVIRRSLVGAEEYLREAATSQRLGVGRSVVRRVFTRLSGAGLLDHVPRSGFRVRPYREEDVVAFVDVREVLELKALELARDRLDMPQLRLLHEANSPAPDGTPRLDNSLHQCWIESSGNRYIEDFFRLQGSYFQALFDFAAAELATAAMADQHREILQALIELRWGQAKKALREHIRAQKPTLLRFIARYREAVADSS